MSRGLLVILIGLAAGAASYAGYFHLHRQFDPDSLEGQLAWMKSELGLSDAQYRRIDELHQRSSARLRALAAQVSRMQAEFAAFENTRRTSDKVDFIEFARFVEARRTVNRECIESTRSLVAATAGEMSQRQREQYLGMVALINTLDEKQIN